MLPGLRRGHARLGFGTGEPRGDEAARGGAGALVSARKRLEQMYVFWVSPVFGTCLKSAHPKFGIECLKR